MAPFWTFAKLLLRNHATVAWAVIYALIAASGLAVGLLSLAPILRLILTGDSLADLAVGFNKGDYWITIPAWVIPHLPQDPFQGVLLLVGALLLLTVIGGLANFMHLYLSQTLATKTCAEIRQRAFRHVIRVPLTRVMTRGPSEFVARIIRDTAELQRGFIALTSRAVTQMLKGAAAFVAAFTGRSHWARWCSLHCW